MSARAGADPAVTLARWEAEEAALRERMPAPGVVDPRQAAARPALALFEDMLAGRAPPAPISRTLGFLLVHVEPGKAVFQGRPDATYNNPMGGIHGGWYGTLLDSALGCAVHTTLAAGQAYTTLEYKVNLVRGLDTRVPLVRAEGRVLHAGRQVATAEAELRGPDGRLYAHATTTCLVFEARA